MYDAFLLPLPAGYLHHLNVYQFWRIIDETNLGNVRALLDLERAA